MAKGDLRELQIAREAIPDGSGGETPGLVVRVWLDNGDGNLALIHELRSRLEGPEDVDGTHEWAIAWLNQMVL